VYLAEGGRETELAFGRSRTVAGTESKEPAPSSLGREKSTTTTEGGRGCNTPRKVGEGNSFKGKGVYLNLFERRERVSRLHREGVA